MGTPTYIVRKIGDQYVPVLQEQAWTPQSGGFLAGGAMLAFLGHQRGGLLGMLASLSGWGLIVRGATGINPLSLVCPCFDKGATNGRPSEAPSYQNDFAGRAPQMPADVVDEESMESFPASDPPARTGTILA